MTELLVRAVLTDDDLDQAAALRWRWVVEDDGGAPVVDDATFRRSFHEWAADPAARRRGFLGELDGRVVGMCWLAFIGRVPSPRKPDRSSADLQAVYVTPESRRLGVARRLVGAAIEAARLDGAERLVVHSSDVAIPVYARLGFQRSERLMHVVLSSPRTTADEETHAVATEGPRPPR